MDPDSTAPQRQAHAAPPARSAQPQPADDPRAEDDYRTLVENLHIGVYRTTPGIEARLLRANPALARILGYHSVEELLRLPVVDHFQHREDLAAVVDDVEREGLVQARLSAMRRKDGTPFWAQLTATAKRDAQGRVIWVDGVVEDVTARKQAEDGLRRSEQHLRAVVDNAPIILWAIDRNGTVRFMRGAGMAGVGIKAERVVGARAQDVFPDLADKLNRNLARVLVGEKVRSLTETRERTFETEYSPLRDADGTVTGAVIVTYDVTERKRMEDALRESEEKYRAVVEGADEIIATLDADGRFLFMNGTAAEQMGAAPDELVGKTMWDLFPKDLADRQVEKVRQAIRTGRPFVEDNPTVVRGEQRWYSTNVEPLRDANAKVYAALIVARDITEHRQAAEDLRRSELLYHTTIDALSDAIHVVDRDLRITMVNKTFENWCRELGLTTEIAGRYLFDVFPFLPQKVRDECRQVFETGRPLLTEESTFVAGREIFTETLKMPLRAHGRVDRIITVVRDISERKRAEAALQTAHAEIVRAREEQSRRLGAELHDSVGQKLVALQLAARGAAHHPLVQQDEPLARQLALAAQSCTELIREVRNICHGLYPPTLESLGLVSALEELAKSCRGARVHVEVSHTAGLEGRRFGDDVDIALFRAAQEAVNNALRHADARNVRLELRQEDAHLVLRVRDDGEGFDADEAAGQGLGLTVMKERATSVGGTLHVASAPGESCIELRVPLSASTKPPRAPGRQGGLANPAWSD